MEAAAHDHWMRSKQDFVFFTLYTDGVFFLIVRVKSCISFACALTGLPAGRQALSLPLIFWFVMCNVFYVHFDSFLFRHIPLKPKHCCASTFRKKISSVAGQHQQKKQPVIWELGPSVSVLLIRSMDKSWHEILQLWHEHVPQICHPCHGKTWVENSGFVNSRTLFATSCYSMLLLQESWARQKYIGDPCGRRTSRTSSYQLRKPIRPCSPIKHWLMRKLTNR